MPSPMYQQYQQPQNNMMGLFSQFMQNPMAMLSQRYNIPQNLNNPNDILQYLLNTNQVSQQQVNNAVQMANSPQVRQMFGGQ